MRTNIVGEKRTNSDANYTKTVLVFQCYKLPIMITYRNLKPGTAQIAAFLCSKSRVGSCRRSATCSVEMAYVMAWGTTKTHVIVGD